MIASLMDWFVVFMGGRTFETIIKRYTYIDISSKWRNKDISPNIPHTRTIKTDKEITGAAIKTTLISIIAQITTKITPTKISTTSSLKPIKIYSNEKHNAKKL